MIDLPRLEVFTVFNARSDEQSAFVGMGLNKWAAGFAPAVDPAANCGSLCPCFAASVLDRCLGMEGLAVLHSGGQLSTMAAGAEQTYRSRRKTHSAVAVGWVGRQPKPIIQTDGLRLR